MQPSSLIIFSSLVCWAAVSVASPKGDNFESDYEFEYEYDQTQDANPASAALSESVAITPAGKVNIDALKSRKLHRDKMVTPFALSTLLQIDTQTRFGFGMHFGWRSKSFSVWQADLIANKDLEVRGGISNYHKSQFSESVLTFWKWGLANQFVAKQQLASFLNTENYFLRLGIGTENQFSETKVRLETEVFTSVRLKKTGFYLFITYLFSN